MTIELTMLAIAVIGLLVYALASNAKVAEIGRLVFFGAILAMFLGMGTHGGVFRVR